MSLSMVMSLVVTMIGVVYTASTLMLPAARIGNPTEPKVFPLMLGIALLILGTILIVQEIKRLPKTDEEKAKAKATLSFGDAEKRIALTLLNGIIYALLFNRAGYVFSTIIFLEAELTIFRGFRKWANSLIISVSFALIAYLLFDIGLGIYLPSSPLGFM